MDLDDIKAQLDRIFAAGNRTSTRAEAAALRDALVAYRVAIAQLREAASQSEHELELARKSVADYQRRGQLAAEIEDSETARIATEFATRVAERVELLERKVIVQRDELAMAEREYDATKQRFQLASRGIAFNEEPTPAPAPDSSPMDQAMSDQRAREAAVEAQLAHLKKKLGEKR